jgi:hypothetical protein
MTPTLTFFPVGCGDMTLVQLGDENETKILIDCNIRDAADDSDDDTRDVAADLRRRLKRDDKKRPYVDAFGLSHPDHDHCNGLQKHFWLGRPEDYPDDKKPDNEKRIFIRELWSSPLVFRRAERKEGFVLCEDAKAFWAEARRRVKLNESKNFTNVAAGDRILVLGEDEDGKTDNLGPVLVKIDQVFNRIDMVRHDLVRIRLLAPLPKSSDANEEDVLSKNNSSIVLNFKIAADRSNLDACRFLTGGDAEVAVWERLWQRHKATPDVLLYNVLLSPHHCSWHSLSWDSWSDLREEAEVSPDARSALAQARSGAIVVASSDPIVDDDNDPPCIRAKREYEEIVDEVDGEFLCTGEFPTEKAPAPLEVEVTRDGPRVVREKSKAAGSQSLLRPAAAAGLAFPDRPQGPNKPAGFA